MYKLKDSVDYNHKETKGQKAGLNLLKIPFVTINLITNHSQMGLNPGLHIIGKKASFFG